MCLHLKTVRNPTKRLSIYGGQCFRIQVPCGKCADCKKKRRREWYFRSWHQVDDCLRHGGYVYFDTLTYRPKDVPRLSSFVDVESLGITDYMCFNSKHWRDFLKNLRRHLSYHYPGTYFKYFLTSEYGTDERYTHRPHYHILFFVYKQSGGSIIHPYKLSRIISRLWHYGRTDGLPYHTRKYVSEHIYGYNVGFGLKKDALKVCSYVSKYVNKDSSFQSNIDMRLKVLQEKFPPVEFESISRHVQMFHRQSQGFGLSFLEHMSKRDYDNAFNGICQMTDKDEVIFSISLPTYYMRKLFYKCVKSDDGVLSWIPTINGLGFLDHKYICSIDNSYKQYYELYINATSLHQSVIDKLLSGRSLLDYVIYKLFYQYRTSMFGLRGSLSVDTDLYSWLDTIKQSLFVYEFDDFEYLQRDNFDDLTINDYSTSLNSYEKSNTISQASSFRFRNFDELDRFFDSLKFDKYVLNDATCTFLENHSKIIKPFYYETKI